MTPTGGSGPRLSVHPSGNSDAHINDSRPPCPFSEVHEYTKMFDLIFPFIASMLKIKTLPRPRLPRLLEVWCNISL